MPRGITRDEVFGAADWLLLQKERPTVARVRATLGRGSPNTITPWLDEWWKALGDRLPIGREAFTRLPVAVAQIAEALWLRALEDARRRLTQEQKTSRAALEHARAETDARAHVLSQREAELGELLANRERQIDDLASQLRAVTRLLTRERAISADLQARTTRTQKNDARTGRAGASHARAAARRRRTVSRKTKTASKKRK